MEQIRAIDLFCGVGGLTSGLLKAGISVTHGIDILQDSDIGVAYEKNNKGVSYIMHDIEKLQSDFVRELLHEKKRPRTKTMLAGCAPCQPFSMKNRKRQRKEDKRKNLTECFGKLVSEILPDFVLMENVPGMRFREPGILELFVRILEQNGYKCVLKIVDATRYGVPQQRRRLVLIARRNARNLRFPVGNYDGITKPFKTVRETIGNLPRIAAGTVHEKITYHKAAGLSIINKKRIQATPKDGGDRTFWNDSLRLKCHEKTNGFKDVYARMYWDRPAPTLTTRFFSYSTGRYGHPEQDRALSLKEGALLQSFPNDYIFGERDSFESIGKQIGNAVPPTMAEAFGRYILSLV